MSDNNSNSFLWFLAGLGIGAVAGVLYAPRSGDETRQALRARADDSREFVRDRARQAREQATTWADRGREVLNQQKEQFRFGLRSRKAGLPGSNRWGRWRHTDSLIRESPRRSEAEERLWTIYRYSSP